MTIKTRIQKLVEGFDSSDVPDGLWKEASLIFEALAQEVVKSQGEGVEVEFALIALEKARSKYLNALRRE